MWKEREGEDRNGCPSVAREISARWFGNGELRVSCVSGGQGGCRGGHTATVSFAFIKTHI